LLGLELIWGEGFKSVQINASKLVKELLRDHYKDSGSRPQTQLSNFQSKMR